MIINSRKDLDNAPEPARSNFISMLESGINRWDWADGDWTLVQDTATIERFGFTVADFPDAPVPEKPDYNQDQKQLEQARESATLTRMAFMLALEDAGLYDEVEAAIESDQVDKRAKIMWHNASQFERMNPDLLAMAQALGYTDEQMDAIFGVEV